MYLNNVIVALTLGRDAESKKVGERYVINLNGASTRKYTNAKNEEQSVTTWLACKYWVKNDSLAKYLTKGKGIIVQGALESETWEKDGQKHERTYINVQTLTFLPDARANEQKQDKEQEQAERSAGGDLPF